MGRRARAYAESEADRAIAIGRYESVLSELQPRGVIVLEVVFWVVARRARLDARRATRWRPRVARPRAAAAGAWARR